ncbi:hypothetical protein P4O66_001746 [Electrophorus voltai]|uniref:Uncharacterized protein n=1 Tax=Electrophorus voltai TaxID=2609070 RepID=A0AAD9DL58_9TELE|nr:hypothetical protein P4O66_001746 [Electrophorus voltai]
MKNSWQTWSKAKPVWDKPHGVKPNKTPGSEIVIFAATQLKGSPPPLVKHALIREAATQADVSVSKATHTSELNQEAERGTSGGGADGKPHPPSILTSPLYSRLSADDMLSLQSKDDRQGIDNFINAIEMFINRTSDPSPNAVRKDTDTDMTLAPVKGKNTDTDMTLAPVKANVLVFHSTTTFKNFVTGSICDYSKAIWRERRIATVTLGRSGEAHSYCYSGTLGKRLTATVTLRHSGRGAQLLLLWDARGEAHSYCYSGTLGKRHTGSDEQLQKTGLDGCHDIEASKEQLEMERCNLEAEYKEHQALLQSLLSERDELWQLNNEQQMIIADWLERENVPMPLYQQHVEELRPRCQEKKKQWDCEYQAFIMMMQEVVVAALARRLGKRAALVEVKRLLAAEQKTENKLTAAKIRNLALQMRSHLKETLNFVELEIQAKLANLDKVKAMIGNKRKALAGVVCASWPMPYGAQASSNITDDQPPQDSYSLGQMMDFLAGGA